jgi:copper chaperone CopZ
MKKNILILMGCFSLLMAGSSCRQHDLRTLVIDVPQMRNQACANIVAKALWPSPGLKRITFTPKYKNEPVPYAQLLSDSVKFDIDNHKVTVVFDSLLTADKNIEFLIAKAGFAANSIPADKTAAAALPAECRR